MDTNNEILDAIEILADKKIGENITKVLTGVCTAVNVFSKNTCTMNCNGVSSTVFYYGNPPEINGLYRIFVPSNDMSRAFVIVPPSFTVNPNLFDNWDYSVNQRGITAITSTNDYYADRWRKYGSAATGTVEKGLVHITSTGTTTFGWQQRFEVSRLTSGIIYTFSALVKPVKSTVITLSYGTAIDSITASKNYAPPANAWSLIQWTFTLPAASSYYNFRISSTAIAMEYYIGPMKLEVGPNQTLAHRENGNWVINEESKIANQLQICQRYAIPLNRDTFGYGRTGISADTSVIGFLPTPVTMRATPVLQNGAQTASNYRIYHNGVAYTPTAVSSGGVKANGIILNFTVPTGIGTIQPCTFAWTPDTIGRLSANL